MQDTMYAEQPKSASAPDVLTGIFDVFAPRIYRLAMGLVRLPVEAEDVVQQTFLALLTHADRLDGRAGVGTWLYRVAYNACIDRLREHPEYGLSDEIEEPDAEESLPLPEALVSCDFNPEEALLDAEARSRLDTAIQALPEPFRAALILRDIEGLTTVEASEVLGISVSLTKARVRRARLALRLRLAAYFAERCVAEAS